MLLLLTSSVGVPILAIILFALLEAVGGTRGLWEQLIKVALDMCIVSIGIVGGMFMNVQLAARLSTGGPILAILVVLFSMILAALVMLVDKRLTSQSDRVKASVCLFFGALAVAIPSGIIVWIGGR